MRFFLLKKNDLMDILLLSPKLIYPNHYLLMKKQLLSLFVLGLSFTQMNAQSNSYWSLNETGKGKVATDKAVSRITFPKEFKLFSLDINPLRQELFSVLGTTAKKQSVVISLPNADGQLEQFEVFEASNFDAVLQAQFPEIRAYSGKGITDKYATLKLSISPQGIQTMIFRTDKENEFIEPYSQDHSVYSVFKSQRERGKLAWTCAVDDKKMVTQVSSQLGNTYSKSSTGQLKTMRLAQSCTGEYAAYFGATTAGNASDQSIVLTAINNTLTRCNGVYEKDLGLHLNLIAQTTNVIYYNAATDPYSDAGTAGSGDGLGADGAWNGQLEGTLNTKLNPAGTIAQNNSLFDIGHLFGASGGGGNAGCIGCVCVDGTSGGNTHKGSGFTSPADAIPQGDNFDIDYVVHEVGHQLGGNHTFSMSNEGSGVNVEPGSGVTIMGYAGITSQDVAPHSIDAYHAATIAQIQTNLAGKACPVTTNITANNATPVANAGLDYTIPVSTPFKLTGSATDANAGDALTYSWEEMDNASAAQTAANSAAIVTKATGPNWRSFSPTASTFRYFPQLATTLANSPTTAGTDINTEALSSVARTLNFRLTVRDNAAFSSTAPVKVGQTNFDDMIVSVSTATGPFDVTSQNVDGISWTQGTSQTITWAVNGTNLAYAPGTAGDQFVDILLSTDGGLTYPTVLAANTPNDGTQVITVPNVAAPFCRVMVKAHSHIFYDINSKAFAIGYTVTTTTTCTDYTRTFPSTAIPTGWTGYGLPASPGVTDSYTISDANVKVVATAARTNQVSFGLVKPGSGTVDFVLFDGPTSGCANSKANLNAIFDDEGVAFNCNATATGASYIPVSALSGVDGMNSSGQWILAAKSSVAGNTLTSATLTLCHTDTTITLAVPEIEFQDFGLFPNPNNGSFTIKFTSATSSDVKIMVHDMRGRSVYDKSFANTGTFNQNIKLDNVEAGIYLVSIVDGAKKTVKRIVVE